MLRCDFGTSNFAKISGWYSLYCQLSPIIGNGIKDAPNHHTGWFDGHFAAAKLFYIEDIKRKREIKENIFFQFNFLKPTAAPLSKRISIFLHNSKSEKNNRLPCSLWMSLILFVRVYWLRRFTACFHQRIENVWRAKYWLVLATYYCFTIRAVDDIIFFAKKIVVSIHRDEQVMLPRTVKPKVLLLSHSARTPRHSGGWHWPPSNTLFLSAVYGNLLLRNGTWMISTCLFLLHDSSLIQTNKAFSILFSGFEVCCNQYLWCDIITPTKHESDLVVWHSFFKLVWTVLRKLQQSNRCKGFVFHWVMASNPSQILMSNGD